MTDLMPPALYFIIGAVILQFLKGRAKQIFMLAIPVIAFINLLNMTEGQHWVVHFLNYELIFGRVDKLSMVFGYIFVLAALIGIIFSLHLKDNKEHIPIFLYIGSSLGVIFSGDLITLFIFWEVMAFASMFIIWAQNDESSYNAGFRYVLIHTFGGVCLLFGIVIQMIKTGSTEFNFIGLNSLASYLILLGFVINAAVPPFSAWLSDAYPEASVTGTVILSAFTTKTAVYVLARAFPGSELLLWAGVIMALYGIVYAILENDMRRVLAYSIINQVGFMVVGIGIGTQMSINGTVAHAFCHIIYKALLLMSAGSVIYVTGKRKCTDLGGLYKTMPLTMIFGVIGAASISAFPLTNGFTSKSMILLGAEQEHLTVIWALLELASAGVFLHAGIKFPWFVFFAKDQDLKAEEPPFHMLLAMGIAAFLCIFLGVYPYPLYSILPFQPVDFVPYTMSHVIAQLQLLLFSALAFFMMLKYLQRTPTISLDTDWFYRKGARAFLKIARNPIELIDAHFGSLYINLVTNPLLKASETIWKFFDVKVIDGLVNNVAKYVLQLGEYVRQYQTGYVRNYALSMVIGLVIILYLFIG